MKVILYAVILSIFFTYDSFSQSNEPFDSLNLYTNLKLIKKPELHYSVGSNLTFIPRYGSVTGVNVSTFLTYPLNPKLAVSGGLIAGRYFSTIKSGLLETPSINAFNSLSVFGTAVYKVNQKFSIYGTGIKTLSNDVFLYNLPKNSYSFGSTIDFGNFSFGAEIRVSDQNQFYSPSLFRNNQTDFPFQSW